MLQRAFPLHAHVLLVSVFLCILFQLKQNVSPLLHFSSKSYSCNHLSFRLIASPKSIFLTIAPLCCSQVYGFWISNSFSGCSLAMYIIYLILLYYSIDTINKNAFCGLVVMPKTLILLCIFTFKYPISRLYTNAFCELCIINEFK